MAHKKGQGSSRNGRDSNSQRRGIKKFGGERVTAGNIIVRQCGTKWHAGRNVGLGRDYTIFSLVDGKVYFDQRGRRVNVSSAEDNQQNTAANPKPPTLSRARRKKRKQTPTRGAGLAPKQCSSHKSDTDSKRLLDASELDVLSLVQFAEENTILNIGYTAIAQQVEEILASLPGVFGAYRIHFLKRTSSHDTLEVKQGELLIVVEPNDAGISIIGEKLFQHSKAIQDAVLSIPLTVRHPEPRVCKLSETERMIVWVPDGRTADYGQLEQSLVTILKDITHSRHLRIRVVDCTPLAQFEVPVDSVVVMRDDLKDFFTVFNGGGHSIEALLRENAERSGFQVDPDRIVLQKCSCPQDPPKSPGIIVRSSSLKDYIDKKLDTLSSNPHFRQLCKDETRGIRPRVGLIDTGISHNFLKHFRPGLTAPYTTNGKGWEDSSSDYHGTALAMMLAADTIGWIHPDQLFVGALERDAPSECDSSHVEAYTITSLTDAVRQMKQLNVDLVCLAMAALMKQDDDLQIPGFPMELTSPRLRDKLRRTILRFHLDDSMQEEITQIPILCAVGNKTGGLKPWSQPYDQRVLGEPAPDEHAISVGSTGNDFGLHEITCFNYVKPSNLFHPQLAAPHDNLAKALCNNADMEWSGTSFSTAFSTGIAAHIMYKTGIRDRRDLIDAIKLIWPVTNGPKLDGLGFKFVNLG